jgi:hypothetical protein
MVAGPKKQIDVARFQANLAAAGVQLLKLALRHSFGSVTLLKT